MRTHILNVPVINQVSVSDCAPACAKMILNFYGHRISLQKITKHLGTRSYGTRIPQIGNFFIDEGFYVTMVIWIHDWFPMRFFCLKDDIARKTLLRWCRYKPREESHELYRKELASFIRKGGTVIPRMVTLRDITHSIRAGNPPILFINPSVLWQQDRVRWGAHAVVATGINGDLIKINDPGIKRGYPQASYPWEMILHALYIWESCALFIQPK